MAVRRMPVPVAVRGPAARLSRLSAHLLPTRTSASSVSAASSQHTALDTCGNEWTLSRPGELVCLPGAWGLTTPGARQPAASVPLPAAMGGTPNLPFVFDCGNYLWLSTTAGELWRLHPSAGRRPGLVPDAESWAQHDTNTLPEGCAISGIEVLPTGHAAVAVNLADGTPELLALDISEGVSTARLAAPFVEQTANSAWDAHAVPNLPFGNHGAQAHDALSRSHSALLKLHPCVDADIHARELGGKLFVAAGLASGGFPLQCLLRSTESGF
jgi:hypothetical protein